MKDSKSHHDAQTLDVATAEQQEEQGQITQDNEEDNSDVDGDEEMAEDVDDTEVNIYKTKIFLKISHPLFYWNQKGLAFATSIEPGQPVWTSM